MIHVWIDQDLCTGDGLCTDHCPEVFVLLDDGISYVQDASSGSVGNDPGGRSSIVAVPGKLDQHVVDAALDCPGECIFIEVDPTDDDHPIEVSYSSARGAGQHEHDGHSEHHEGVGVPGLGESLEEPDVGRE